ncbi:hypothetical protein UA08_08383 [Talaromyces atroroseus]|uniref:Uncharacterized protein n=1 Tax=Talaromyces atroroseus TaxID=1441469 RepID=A0A1Q5Q7N3_TALAT|nr:hypothetical protein UA08_08383 [Talaromyces atroroseus]OKL56228.1 hypothetical protein UA08_08383 [Talaromyces atroroseus]
MPFIDVGHSHNEPVTRVRDLFEDETFVLTKFENHANKCALCIDALDTFREGRSLCDRGLAHAKDVANYVFSKQGKAYSVVNKEHNEEVLIRIPRQHRAARRLLRAIEEGLHLRRDQPIVSYDRTYHVGARQPAETVTEIIERTPRRRVIVYRRSSPSRSSPNRGSLYETDRHERRQYVRVLR